MNAKKLISLGVVVCISCLVSLNAWAGERYVGTIQVTTSSLNNTTTGGTPFVITPNARITIQCDAVTFIQPDASSTTASIGIRLAADEIFYTSVGSLVTTVLSGTRTSLLSAIVSAGTANCKVWERRGNE